MAIFVVYTCMICIHASVYCPGHYTCIFIDYYRIENDNDRTMRHVSQFVLQCLFWTFRL